MGTFGGGPGSFIGPVHRIIAELDREIELLARARSSDPVDIMLAAARAWERVRYSRRGARVGAGVLGAIRKLMVEHPQGSLGLKLLS